MISSPQAVAKPGPQPTFGKSIDRPVGLQYTTPTVGFEGGRCSHSRVDSPGGGNDDDRPKAAGGRPGHVHGTANVCRQTAAAVFMVRPRCAVSRLGIQLHRPAEPGDPANTD